MDNPKKAHCDILLALEAYPSGLKNYQIRSYLSLKTKQITNYYLKSMLKKGWIQEYDQKYRLTEQGKNLLPLAHVLPAAKPKLQVRIHNYGLSYELSHPLGASQPPILLNAPAIALKHNTYGLIHTGSITLKLTTRHLEIYTKDIYTDNRTPAIVAEAAIKERFDSLALEQEQLAKGHYSLMRIGTALYSKVVKQHWAEEHHSLAEQADSNTKTILAIHPIDKQQRLIVDMSKGFKELETVHKLTAGEDKDSIDRQFNAVLDGDIDLMHVAKIERIEEALDRLVSMQEERDIKVANLYANIALHLKVMRKIDVRLNQKVLKEYF